MGKENSAVRTKHAKLTRHNLLIVLSGEQKGNKKSLLSVRENKFENKLTELRY